VSGLSLLAAVLNNFVERGTDCPHIFVATHMHRVMNMLPRSPIIEEQVRRGRVIFSGTRDAEAISSNCRCSFDLLSISLFTMQTFEFVTNEDGSVAYLYSLTSGHVARSFAHAAARSAGLDEKIVKRALEVIADFASRTFKTFTCKNHVNSIILIDIVRILKTKTFVGIRKI